MGPGLGPCRPPAPVQTAPGGILTPAPRGPSAHQSTLDEQASVRSRVIQFPSRAPPKVMHSAAPAVPSVGSGLAAWRSSKGGPIRLVQTGVLVSEARKGGNG